uniref:Radial spoke protein 3 n=1 Tax=Lotharella globosa TaxID=91324 RepID=A0A7S3Z9G6_9EUKA|mmetsp:Transcript_10193/g.20244  ORF Transcript_10193/g.20244 Transcript_10193/m.20244 type:complete len:360 (+) Transcript_10193:117-1196(+)
MNGQYTFQSAPRAVRNGNRKKYRDTMDEDNRPSNIMYDARVIRGNTYATPVPTRTIQIQQNAMAKTVKRKTIKRAKPIPRSTTPEPVAGRKHTEVQTDGFLEELHDKPFETEIATQTDPLLDHPMAPIFVPKPSGEDKSTEILPGDLFDFDLEVEPILEVLIGKSLDHALTEVLEEEEMKELAAHKQDFEQKRNTMLAEVQRIEAEEKRRIEEKERRIKQAKDFEEKQKEAAEKAKARTLAKQLLSSAQDVVFVNLEKEGKFEEPILKQIKGEFLPWIFNETRERLKVLADAKSAVEALLQDSSKLLDQEIAKQEELDRIAAEEEAKRKAAEAEAKRKAEEEARLKAEAEAKASAEEDD